MDRHFDHQHRDDVVLPRGGEKDNLVGTSVMEVIVCWCYHYNQRYQLSRDDMRDGDIRLRER